MKICDILNSRKIVVSCELFPPRKDAEIVRVHETVQRMAMLRPDYMSVTYHKSPDNTVKVAEDIQANGVTALAHLTCVTSTREDIGRVLDGLHAKHIENILALRGDIPEGAAFPSPRQYRYASELIRQIRERDGFCVGGACYPEGHVECRHKEDDVNYLKQKVDAGCSFLITQMFFDNNILYNFLYRILAKGIEVPVVAGIMPVTNGKQIRRICALSGTQLPQRFRAIVDKFEDKPEAMRQAGIAYATEQIIDLIANGVRAVHIYTMNKPEIAGQIIKNLSAILRG
mgnify:CR=1 FL=1